MSRVCDVRSLAMHHTISMPCKCVRVTWHTPCIITSIFTGIGHGCGQMSLHSVSYTL